MPKILFRKLREVDVVVGVTVFFEFALSGFQERKPGIDVTFNDVDPDVKSFESTRERTAITFNIDLFRDTDMGV